MRYLGAKVYSICLRITIYNGVHSIHPGMAIYELCNILEIGALQVHLLDTKGLIQAETLTPQH